MKHKIDWQFTAIDDLDGIETYHEEYSQETATRIIDEITSRVKTLADFPFLGPKINKNSSKRRLTVGNYSIFYEVCEERKLVQILYVWHQARDASSLA